MTDRIAQAFTAADTAAHRMARYRSFSDAALSEAEALVAQADAKRAESAALLVEVERQDAAYAAALDQVVELGVERADAESMVATRVRMLVKSGVEVPMPTLDAAKPKPKSTPRKAKASKGEAETSQAGQEAGGEGGEAGPASEAKGDGEGAQEDGADKATDAGREGRRPFRLPARENEGSEALTEDRNQKLAGALSALNLAGFNRGAVRGPLAVAAKDVEEAAAKVAELTRFLDDRKAALTLLTEQSRQADDDYEAAAEVLEEFGLDRDSAEKIVEDTMKSLSVAGIEMGMPQDQKGRRKPRRSGRSEPEGSAKAGGEQAPTSVVQAPAPSGVPLEGGSRTTEGTGQESASDGHSADGGKAGDGDAGHAGDVTPAAEHSEVEAAPEGGDGRGTPEGEDLFRSGEGRGETGHDGIELAGDAREPAKVTGTLADGSDATEALAKVAPVASGSRTTPPPAPRRSEPGAETAARQREVVIPDFLS